MLPVVLYFWGADSTFFIAGALEEELNSLLKLQGVKTAKRDTEQIGVQEKKQGRGSPTNRATKEQTPTFTVQ